MHVMNDADSPYFLCILTRAKRVHSPNFTIFLLVVSLPPPRFSLMPPSTSPTRRLVGGLLVFVGAALLLIAIIGHWSAWGRGYGDVKRDWEKFDPALVNQIKDYKTLLAVVDDRLAEKTLSDEEKMRVMYDVLVSRFTHDEALHTLASNWILYTAGFAHPTFRHIWDPYRYISHGYSLLCDQSSYLLMDLARRHGFKTRHVGLQGHVVMEVWYDNDWHLYDPDLEVVPLDAAGKVMSLESLSLNKELTQKYYTSHGDITDLIKNRENHLYMNTPEGARFDWKANILAVFEKVAEWLKFLIPVILIWIGVRWIRQKSQRSRA